MISTKYRKEQKARKKERAIKKLKSAEKQEVKGSKKSHKMRMARRNERLKQKMLFRIAERKRQIEKLKEIIEENKRKKAEEEAAELAKENNVEAVNETYTKLLDGIVPSMEPEESEI